MAIVEPEGLSAKESHRLLTSLFIPRPIAFVGTVSTEGVTNCAPFSFANGISSQPPVMMISISDGPGGTPKDTLRNILATGEFTINLVTESIARKMHESSGPFPPAVSEFDEVGLTPLPSRLISAPGITGSPVTMELKLRQSLRVEGTRTTMVLGDVVLFHVDDDFFEDHMLRPEGLDVVGRLGRDTYTVVREIFRLPPVRSKR